MALEFNEFLDIPPMPTGASLAAAQVRVILGRVSELGSLAQVRDEAVGFIRNATPDDPPSEKKRLRLLYQDVYTDDELTRLVDLTFRDLGLLIGPN